MKSQRLAIVFSALNLVLFVFLLNQAPSKAEPNIPPVLQARAFELVGEDGQVRAQLNVEPGGEVVFRLRHAKGTIRTKLGASEKGSGLVLLDDRTEATVQVRANQAGGNMTLIDRAGNQRVIKYEKE